MTDWNEDMSLAPRDGTFVLVCGMNGHYDNIAWAAWREDEKGWYGCPDCWPSFQWLGTPTHWMPLPEPPQVKP